MRRWRERWPARQAGALADLPVADRLAAAPRAGRPATITAAPTWPLVALAGAAPPPPTRPISQWTGRALAAAMVTPGILEPSAPRQAARWLKRGTANRSGSALGGPRRALTGTLRRA